MLICVFPERWRPCADNPMIKGNERPHVWWDEQDGGTGVSWQVCCSWRAGSAKHIQPLVCHEEKQRAEHLLLSEHTHRDATGRSHFQGDQRITHLKTGNTRGTESLTWSTEQNQNLGALCRHLRTLCANKQKASSTRSDELSDKLNGAGPRGSDDSVDKAWMKHEGCKDGFGNVTCQRNPLNKRL